MSMFETESDERPNYVEATTRFAEKHSGNVWMTVFAAPHRKLLTSKAGNMQYFNTDVVRGFHEESVPSGFVVVSMGITNRGWCTPIPHLFTEPWTEVNSRDCVHTKYDVSSHNFALDQIMIREEAMDHCAYGQLEVPNMLGSILVNGKDYGLLDNCVFIAYLCTTENAQDRLDAQQLLESAVRHYLGSLLVSHFNRHKVKGVTFTNVPTGVAKGLDPRSAISTKGAVNLCNPHQLVFGVSEEIYVLPAFKKGGGPPTLEVKSLIEGMGGQFERAWEITENAIAKYLPVMCKWGKDPRKVDVPGYYPVKRAQVCKIADVLPPPFRDILKDQCFLGKCQMVNEDKSNIEVALGLTVAE
jgi:hypothetical protein